MQCNENKSRLEKMKLMPSQSAALQALSVCLSHTGTSVSKCRRCTAPSYLTDMCIPVSTASGHSCLRSCSRHDLRIPCYRLSRYGSRSFSVSGPTAWNSLPTAVRDLSSSSCFCRHLKTELFSRAYGVN